MENPLSEAILNDDLPTAILLIQGNNGINQPGLSGQTPLFDAIYRGHYELIPLLIQHRANVNVQSDDGTTPLILACRESFIDPEVIALLISNGADINVRDNYGLTPLLSAASSEDNNSVILQLLISLGANINDQSTRSGNSSLILSVLRGNYSNTNVLLRNGADANLVNNRGETARDVASRLNLPEIVRILPMTLEQEQRRLILELTGMAFEDSLEQDRIINRLREEARNVVETCSICCESFRSGDTCVKLPLCGHKFHKECIIGYINSERDKTPPVRCPECRIEVNSLQNLSTFLYSRPPLGQPAFYNEYIPRGPQSNYSTRLHSSDFNGDLVRFSMYLSGIRNGYYNTLERNVDTFETCRPIVCRKKSRRRIKSKKRRSRRRS